MNTAILNLYQWMTVFLPETRFFSLKCWLLKRAGAKIGKNVRICSSVRIIGNGKLSIGDNCWIGPQTLISSSFPAEVKLGNNIDIAPRVFIGTGSHEIDMINLNSAGKGISLNIVIEDGVWICVGSFLLPGVQIGKKAIIAAGSVVTVDIPKYTLGAGNPCRIAKEYVSINKSIDS